MIGDLHQQQRILDGFPFLVEASAGFRAELFGQDGSRCSVLAFVLAGTGRVYKLGEDGREITLYRVDPGESCVVTASCILSGQPFPAFAECETEVEAIVVSSAETRRWMNESEPWRGYIFGLIANRLQEVFGVLDAVLFQRLEQRPISLLLEREASRPGDGIRMTISAWYHEIPTGARALARAPA